MMRASPLPPTGLNAALLKFFTLKLNAGSVALVGVPELWLSAGWDAVTARGWQAPQYWEKHGAEWHTFTLHGMAPVDPLTPVCHVSFYEADAYARWARARLPAEAEWEIAAEKDRAV